MGSIIDSTEALIRELQDTRMRIIEYISALDFPDNRLLNDLDRAFDRRMKEILKEAIEISDYNLDAFVLGYIKYWVIRIVWGKEAAHNCAKESLNQWKQDESGTS